jgi:hypothetical protein
VAKRLEYHIDTIDGLQGVRGTVVSLNFGVHKVADGALKGRYALTHIPSGRLLGNFAKSTTAQACGLNLEIGMPGAWTCRAPIKAMSPPQAAAVGGYVAYCFCYDAVIDFKEFVTAEYPASVPSLEHYWSNDNVKTNT